MKTSHKKANRKPLSWQQVRLLQEKLEPQLAQIFGYHALLYTPLAQTLCNSASAIKHQLVIGNSAQHLDIQCCFSELPIASDTIDLALVPFILQSSSNPHQTLREIERVLIPEGHVIIIGRNPYSWQGIQNTIRRIGSAQVSAQRDISRRRLTDWFRLLGFQAETLINVGATQKRLQQNLWPQWIKTLGQTFCDWFCSYYIIVARKQVSTMTPIRPSWRRNKQLVPPRLAEPSVKAQVDHWFEQLK